MADTSGFNDSERSADDLGRLVFPGEGLAERQAEAIQITDSVGFAFNFFADTVDYFTFTPRGLTTVTVEFAVQADGDYANVIFLAPSMGVSEVSGPAILTSYGGVHQNLERGITDMRAAVDEVAELSLPRFENGELNGTTSTFEGNIWARGSQTAVSATWTLDGSPVVFQAFGMQLDGDQVRGLPDAEGFNEIAYTFTITPLTGEVLNLPPESLFFNSNYRVAETFVGQDGIDTIRIGANREYIDFEIIDEHEASVWRTLEPAYANTVHNVERIKAIDGYIAMDIEGNAGDVYRLYQAAFDRIPDEEGLGFWLNNFDEGYVDLQEIADHFIRSAEFETLYGTPDAVDDRSFLTLLYQNVLDRVPDEAGFDFWRDQQDAGLGRPEMLNYFSDSDENKLNVAPDITDGIWYV